MCRIKQLTILLLFMVSICGCSDDDKKVEVYSVVGSWWNYESVSGKDIFDYRGENRLIVFGDDGKYERFENDNHKDGGSYKISDNKIIMYDYDHKVEKSLDLSINKLNSEYLEINWTYVGSSGSGDTWVHKYKRKL